MNPDSTLAVTNTCPKDGVHLCLEALGQDDQVVFAGFRRGDGEVGSRIVVPRLEQIDNETVATMWDLADPS